MIISPFPTQSVIMKFCLMEFSNDKCNRFQEFYEEGEREILLAELSSLRDQVCVFPESCTKVAFLLANLFGKLLFAFFYKWKVFVVQLLQFHERSSMQSNPNFSPQPQVRLKLSLAPFLFSIPLDISFLFLLSLQMALLLQKVPCSKKEYDSVNLEVFIHSLSIVH